MILKKIKNGRRKAQAKEKVACCTAGSADARWLHISCKGRRTRYSTGSQTEKNDLHRKKKKERRRRKR